MAVSVSVHCEEDPWEKYYVKFEEPTCETIPVGCVLTLPHYQMVSGIYDIFNHICEQYFSGEDDNTSDYISEGLMRGLIHASRIANRDPQDYEARSNIMWSATWALNTLVAKGKSTDWMKELGLVMNLKELGVTEDMIPDLVRGTIVLPGGYKVLDKEEIEQIFRESLCAEY